MKKIYTFFAMLALATMACGASAEEIGRDIDVFLQSPTPTAIVAERGTLAESQAAEEPTGEHQPAEAAQGENPVAEASEMKDLPAVVYYTADQAVPVVSAEYMQTRRPDENVNSLGLNTQLFVCDAGTYLTPILADAEANPSAWLVSPDTQFLLSTAGTWSVAVDEGAASWVTADALHGEVNGYSFDLESKPGHTWFAIIINKDWDHLPDSDLNLVLEVSQHNPGFAQANRFPPGKCLSQLHLEQNVDSAHVQKSSGSDGSTTVGVFILDARTGGHLTLEHTKKGGWTYVDGNIVITP